jgi:hypothetical protein
VCPRTLIIKTPTGRVKQPCLPGGFQESSGVVEVGVNGVAAARRRAGEQVLAVGHRERVVVGVDDTALWCGVLGYFVDGMVERQAGADVEELAGPPPP